MSKDFDTQPLRATTRRIDDPGALHELLPAGKAMAFTRRGEGIIGFGEVARFECAHIADADDWWLELAAGITHSSELPDEPAMRPLAFGTFTFDPWRSTESSALILPRKVIGRRDGVAWETTIEGGDPLDPTVHAPTPLPRLSLTQGTVTQDEWARIVARCVELIREGDVHKVVLARDLMARADESIDLRAVLTRLVEKYPMTWTYLVDGMIGATPEMLVRVGGGLVTSRVLAGTVSVDPAHTDPLSAAARLTQSQKDVGEHEFAVRSVADALAPYCRAMNVPETPSVLQLPNVLHLATDITGVAINGATALKLAGELHPSAAVCGTPTPLARDTIAEIEGMDRGRYAGPVGWVDSKGDGEWGIALRGGYVDPSVPEVLRLFAGAGIVADSDPQSELMETRAKFLPMLQALGLD